MQVLGKARSQHGHDRFTRRGMLLGSASLSLAAAAGLPRVATAAEDVGPVMAKLSAYMSEAGTRALPDAIAEQARFHILDTFAAMVSGSELPPGRHALRFARAYGGEKAVTIAASKILAGPIEAAIVNGMLAQADESDDNYSAGGAHPGCAIVPAALSMGETFGVDGARFLRAVTLGYDVGMRAFKTVYNVTTIPDLHNIVGTFGASATAGSIAGFDAQKMRWLLDYAAQQAGSGFGAWTRDIEHTEKSFVFSVGARNGVAAALMVQSGWTGVGDVFSGGDNFFQSYAPKAKPTGLIDQLGERYEVALTIIKKWTSGGPTQSPLDGIVNMRKKRPFEAADVKQVAVRVSQSGFPKVNNTESPDLCLQYLIAVLLLDKAVSFRAAHDKARMTEPRIMKERAKVVLTADEELERILPKRVALVEVTLNDGTVMKERIDTVRGTPEDPMNKDEVVAKARDLMVPVLGAKGCDRLVDKVLAIEKVKNIRELRPLLQRA
jgi:2-methylcitrate dehydratase PrpD